jgi:hypothetical protein
MKHITRVTVAKADSWNDIGNWFNQQWDGLGDFWRQLFNKG